MAVNITVGNNEKEWNRKRPEPDYAVYVQDFEDDYHRDSHEPSTDLERSVRRIKRRYRKLDDYLAAVSAYNDYMVLVVQKNGGPDLYKLKLKQGYIEDFIPPKPRMKSTTMNNFLLKNKVVLSNVSLKNLDPEKMEEAAVAFLIDPDEKEEDLEGMEVSPAKEGKFSKKLLRSASHQVLGSTNRALEKVSSIARLEQFHLNNKRIQTEDVYQALEDVSVTDVINGEYEDPDAYDPLESVSYKGRYVTAETRDQLEFFATLNEAGWNSVKIQRRQTGSKVTATSSRMKRLLQDESKSLKRSSKKKKKRNKEVGNFLMELTGQNGYDSFEDYERDMFDMTSTNLKNSSDY